MRETESSNSQIRVLVVDDNPLTRSGLKQVLTDGVDIVGVAETAEDAVMKSDLLQPDVILMEVNLPDGNGIQVAARIRERQNSVRVIMFTSYDSDDYVKSSLGAGASGYCIKGAHSNLLPLAIRSVYAGAMWLDSPAARKVVADYARATGSEAI